MPRKDDALGLHPDEGPEHYVRLDFDPDLGVTDVKVAGLSIPELVICYWRLGFELFRMQATFEAEHPPAVKRKPSGLVVPPAGARVREPRRPD